MLTNFPLIAVCSSRSVSSWWRSFSTASIAFERLWAADDRTPADRVFDEAMIAAGSTGGHPKVLVLSEHRTLERDARLVERMRRANLCVVGANADKAMFELDKISAKRFFDITGIDTPRWSLEPLEVDRQLRKPSQGTEASGISWHRGPSSPRGESGAFYFEEFVQGVEYSVIVAVSSQGITALPPVWKGSTASELVPPYKRLRLCGPNVVGHDLQTKLWDTSFAVAAGFQMPCLLEIEYVVGGNGVPQVLEINPRIAGTTRMASMAAGAQVFDLCFEPAGQPRLAATRIVAELPVTQMGDDTVLSADIIATSRLTLAADSWEGLADKLLTARSFGWLTENPATDAFYENIARATGSKLQ